MAETSSSNTQLFLSLACLGLTSHIFFVRHSNVDRIVGKTFLPFLIIQFGFWLLLSTTQIYEGGVISSAILLSLANASLFGPLFASISLYRLYFHPLRSFPGPGLARLTSWWGVAKLATGANKYELHDELHKQHGKIVRIAPNFLSVNSLDGVAAIYGAGTKCGKSNTFYGMRDSKSLQLETSLKRHGARRVPWDKALSAKKSLEYLPNMYRLTDLLVKRIAEAGAKSDNAVLINHWMTCFVFDLMGEISYSKSYGCLDSGEVPQAINELDKFMAASVLLGALPWLVRIMTSIPGAPAPMKGLQDFATASLAERKKATIQSPDVLSYVFQGKVALTHEEEIQDTVMLQIAGSDTTKSVLIFIMYHLAINPEIQSELRKEIETRASVYLYCEELQDLPLLEGVINETLRVHPAVPSGLPRLTPPEGVQVGHIYIPGNTTVSCPTWTIQHDPESFTDPNTWNPYRWSNPPANHNPKAFIPFSAGPFNCVGKAFAYMEMRHVIAKLVSRFEFQLGAGEDGCKVVSESEDHVAMVCAPLWLEMKPIS